MTDSDRIVVAPFGDMPEAALSGAVAECETTRVEGCLVAYAPEGSLEAHNLLPYATQNIGPGEQIPTDWDSASAGLTYEQITQ